MIRLLGTGIPLTHALQKKKGGGILREQFIHIYYIYIYIHPSIFSFTFIKRFLDALLHLQI